MKYTLEPNSSTWTCFGCDVEQEESDDMPQFCPKCGGVWVRPLVYRTYMERIRAAVRRYRRVRAR